MIPDDVVEEVRARADIVDVIGELVQLKKAGREYKANCPFHEERTPSFYVVPDKGFYKCFGCGKSGDVFSFVMERQGMDFVEAVKHVAARAGVEVREVKRGREEEDPHQPLYETNAFAKDWFRTQLLDPKVGARARAYLEGRGVGMETAERFGLGWAPDEWRALREAAATHGLDEQLMLELGLLGTSEKSSEPYDRFRHWHRNAGRTLPSLLEEFARCREQSLAQLRAWKLTDAELDLPGNHPRLGPVTLRQLLSAWAVHDLGHIAQVARVMAKQYTDAVGPWVQFLPVLTDHLKPRS